MARKLYVELPGTDARSRVVGDLFRAFPQTPQLLQNDRVSMEGLATLTTGLFPFLVGPCRRESWEASDGTPWRSKVVIERCRFLEESAQGDVRRPLQAADRGVLCVDRATALAHAQL